MVGADLSLAGLGILSEVKKLIVEFCATLYTESGNTVASVSISLLPLLGSTQGSTPWKELTLLNVHLESTVVPIEWILTCRDI